MDGQHASSFFAIPIELRRAVYAHLLSTAGQHIQYITGDDGIHHFRLTPCIVSAKWDEEELDGTERNPDKLYWVWGPIYKRRLSSSWGPHWMCEELAFNLPVCEHAHWKGSSTQEAGDIAPASLRGFASALRVCKRMYMELVEEATTGTDFHVTDLRTLKAMLDHRAPAPAPYSFEGSICPCISKLSITLSLPLAFFQAIEAVVYRASPDWEIASTSDIEDNSVGTWLHLHSRLLIQLPKLRKLRVWLDHNNDSYWSVVDERAILAPMEALRTSNPSLELVCVLPKLHPRIEDRQRHYLSVDVDEEEESPSRLVVHRFMRQRYRVVEDRDTGDKTVTIVPDFPVLYKHPLFDGRPLLDVEDYERALWRSGLDVRQHFMWLRPLSTDSPEFTSSGTEHEVNDQSPASYTYRIFSSN
ncbi:hypothetical protein N656DRAFT_778773 [Canariomyces notabilis]|uniref:Uncharacterized protein n=1 Tax=Canariomyces notabilis TaxID=2074819 RepID=A0AAN6TF11_9PEZI|nr:hypothetical protein N656DRAFT_778773 [Canariomyces arenarius]